VFPPGPRQVIGEIETKISAGNISPVKPPFSVHPKYRWIGDAVGMYQGFDKLPSAGESLRPVEPDGMNFRCLGNHVYFVLPSENAGIGEMKRLIENDTAVTPVDQVLARGMPDGPFFRLFAHDLKKKMPGAAFPNQKRIGHHTDLQILHGLFVEKRNRPSG